MKPILHGFLSATMAVGVSVLLSVFLVLAQDGKHRTMSVQHAGSPVPATFKSLN